MLSSSSSRSSLVTAVSSAPPSSTPSTPSKKNNQELSPPFAPGGGGDAGSPRNVASSAGTAAAAGATPGNTTTTARRPRRTVRRSKGDTPGKRQGAYGFQPFVPTSYGIDDVDLLLYTLRDISTIVESDRFPCGPALKPQFHMLVERAITAARNIAYRARHFRTSPPYGNPFERLASPDLFGNAFGGFGRSLDHHALNLGAAAAGDDSHLSSGERVLKRDKIFIPEHPNYNFIGRILGPRGISVRQLEATYDCGILIRGRGSVKNPEREERLRARDAPGFEHLKEPLHVLITAEGATEAECDAKIDKCKKHINRLLRPEYDDYKRRQLAQLAIINGNYDASRGIPPVSTHL